MPLPSPLPMHKSQPLPIATARKSGSMHGTIADLVATLRTANADLTDTARMMIAEQRDLRIRLVEASGRAERAEAELDVLRRQQQSSPVLRIRRMRAR